MSSEVKQWTSDEVRQQFIDYFVKQQGHTYIPSSAVVPYEDPTLLFTNAGMNQFKPIFLGTVDPNSPFAKLKRACNSQKCIRAGGKHNDLEDVGKDVYHHTFFEMLGNWSFGDYFKEEAISWAWDLLVNVYKVNPERLYATYFGGNTEKGLQPDDEARNIWLRFLPPSRVLPFGMKENFWEMGDTGPCGPCTEIHYDRIGGRDASAMVNRDDPDVLEIWNNVFIQFNREDSGELRSLPAKHVDTGMGFERLASVLQHKRSNYDTDVFAEIFEAISQATGARPYQGLVGADDKDNIDTAYRVIADHIRTLTFSLVDGAVPSNDGRGYVLRRILRRAVRYGKQILNAPPGFFSKLSAVVFRKFKNFFPELAKEGVEKKVYDLIYDEEAMFSRTLDNGLARFDKMTKELRIGDMISGVDAATLYDTFGFPVDLTQLMARERGLLVDVQGYERRMEELKELSRANSSTRNEVKLDLGAEQTDALSKRGIHATDDASKYEWKSVGEGPTQNATVRAIYAGENKFVDEIKVGSTVGIVLDRTNFYAEAGGQVFDEGEIHLGDQNIFQVTNVQKYGGFILHVGNVTQGSFAVNQAVTLHVNFQRRALIAKNHTTTHILNFALRDVLGNDVDQKGSLVDPQKLRFDFSTNKPTAPESLVKMEQIVQNSVSQDLPVHRLVVPLSEAKSIKGLRAVFGETYPDPVRVVSVGTSIEDMLRAPNNEEWLKQSTEFCGGTHLDRTGEAELFVIISEEGIAKGIRRLTAFTFERARQAVKDGESLLKQIHEALSLEGAALTNSVAVFNRLSKEVVTSVGIRQQIEKGCQQLFDKDSKSRKQAVQASIDAAIKSIPQLAERIRRSGALFTIEELKVDGQVKAIQAAEKELSKALPDVAILLISAEESSGKVQAVAIVPDALASKLSAAEWLNSALQLLGGKAGGKPNRAQGAAPDSVRLPEAIQAAQQLAQSKLH